MTSFQAAVGLPPLSAIAAATHEPETFSTPATTGVSILNNAPVDYREARIEEPVAKNPRGKASSPNGKLGLVQIGPSSQAMPLGRDELAERASESRELAAMRAYQDGYAMPSSKRFVSAMPGDPQGSWDAYYDASASVSQPAAQDDAQPDAQPDAPSGPHTAFRQSLTAAETKEEQARLLALLRSLSPSSVVDQICKALTYFGGIPGAAPPSDGVFPKSELANGSGSVFVGWIAEIFPRLNDTSNSMKAMQQSNLTALSFLLLDGSADTPSSAAAGTAESSGSASDPLKRASSVEPSTNADLAAPADTSAAHIGKRPRGRPKGSKATKTRRDKGIKKGPMKAGKPKAAAAAAPVKTSGTFSNEPSGFRGVAINSGKNGQDSWGEVDDHGMLGAVGDGVYFSANTAAGNVAGAGTAAGATAGSASGMGQAVLGTGDITTAATGSDSNPMEARKKRGRPKGSKNRPKITAADTSNTTPLGAAPASLSPIPPPVVPGVATPSEKPTIKKSKASGTKHQHLPGQSMPVGPDAARNPGPPQSQNIYDTPTSAAARSSSPISTTLGNKRKRTKVSKHDGVCLDPAQGPHSAGGPSVPAVEGSHIGQPEHLLQPTPMPNAKKQRKMAHARTSARGSINSSASPTTRPATDSATTGQGQAVARLGNGQQESHSLDARSDTGREFNIAAFEALARMGQEENNPVLAGQQQHGHGQSLSSLYQQQLQPQNSQHLRQQSLVTQESVSSTTPFPGSDHFLDVAGNGRLQLHQQHTQQPHGQGQGSDQTQQQHSHKQAAGHAVSPNTPAQHHSQKKVPGSLPPSLLSGQELPRPSRTPKAFYAQSGAGVNSHFSQPLPQPRQQQQTHRKQLLVQQYQTQGQYAPQPQHQQQVFASPQRHPSQSMDSSPPELLSQGNAHSLPQFRPPNSAAALRTETGAYGTGSSAGGMNFGPSAYDPARRQNAAGSPPLSSTHGALGADPRAVSHHHSPSFLASRPQYSSGASHTHNVSNAAQNMHGFHGFDHPSLFDSIGLDATGGGGSLDMGSPSGYNLGGVVPRPSSNTGGFGPPSSVSSLDAGMAGNSGRERIFDVRG